MLRKKALYTGKGWGRMKKNKKIPDLTSDNLENVMKYRADKLSEEIEERLRASVKVYTNKEYSQEFLRTLVDQRSL